MIRLPRYRVHIPTKTSHNVSVPKYEVRVLRRIWGDTVGDKPVTVNEIPVSEPVMQRYIDIPDVLQEYNRLIMRYSTATIPGTKNPIIPAIWPTYQDFYEEVKKLVEEAADTPMDVGSITVKIDPSKELMDAKFEGVTEEMVVALTEAGITGIADIASRDIMAISAIRGFTPPIAKSVIAQAKEKLQATILEGEVLIGS